MESSRFRIAVLNISLLHFLILIQACSDEVNIQEASIQGTITHSEVSNIEIFTYQFPGGGIQTLSTPIIDQSFSARIDLIEPTQIFITLGSGQFYLYLKPGDSLILNTDARAFLEKLNFTGTGSDINNYLVKKNQIQVDHEKKYSQAGTIEEFTKNEDLLQQQLTKNLSSIKKIDPFYAIEEASIIAQWINRKHYFIMTYSDLGTRNIKDHWLKLTLDNDEALINQTYRKAVDNLFNQKVVAAVSDPRNYSSGYHAVFEEILVMEQNGIMDYLLASNLNNRIDYYGIVDLKDDYLLYREKFPLSPYLINIESKYNAWDRITPGNPAPDVSFTNELGQVVSLSDFHGKPVYIDIWASWCKPCLEEIPFRKNLSESFPDGDVILLNVSVDEQEENWINAMMKYPEFSGTHVLGDNGWSSAIMKDYLIQEIPKYIIIDAQGNINTLNAPPPSSSEVLVEVLKSLIPST